MTLIGYRNPYRRPSNCPRHPLHSEPCPLCYTEKRKNELEIEPEARETPETQDVYIRNDEGGRTREAP